MGELDDFLAELQAERLPRAPGAAADTASTRDPTGAKSLESALELLMGDRSSGGGAPGACASCVFVWGVDMSSQIPLLVPVAWWWSVFACGDAREACVWPCARS